ncbi:MAG: hypothetical protein HYY06_32970 [Deltaproteobacteria bacterium]|nr:hypothetical protein [Deltaproteobacteria bacterium]
MILALPTCVGQVPLDEDETTGTDPVSAAPLAARAAPGSWFDLEPDLGICADGMPHEGCPCEGGLSFRCTEPGAGGDCLVGEQQCVEGAWSSCLDLRPSGGGPWRVVNPVRTCGCDPDCREANDVPVQADLSQSNSNGISYDGNRGGIVINSNETNAQYAWIANSDNTVSKLDLSTGVEVSRYVVGLANVDNSASRTAVDGYGNAYVACRAFGAQGSVTKMAGDRSFCIDRNANGRIDTSSNNVAMARGTDECVIWTVRVGGNNGVPRAITIAAGDNNRPEGYPWVGLYNENRFYRLDPTTGAASAPAWGGGRNYIDVGGSPYGATIDRAGNLWFPNGCCGGTWIRSFNVGTGALGARQWDPWSSGSYGIAVDGTAPLGRVIMGGWSAGSIKRFDPNTGGWQRWVLQVNCYRDRWGRWVCSQPGGRGVAVDSAGNIWSSSHLNWSNGWVHRINPGNGVITTWQLPDQIPVGVGLDFDNRVWTISQSGSRANRLNLATGAIDRFTTGPSPYTYSDFTGSQRAWFTSPEGFYWRDYDTTTACGNGLPGDFGALSWDADTFGTTSITFEGRTADTQQNLAGAPVVILATQPSDYGPVDVGTAFANAGRAQRRWLRVTAHLRAGSNESPLLRSMTMRWLCDNP